MEVTSQKTAARTTLAAHDDYRSCLRAIFEAKQRVNPRFSARRFAEVVGFKSPNYLQLILDGKRNLSTDMGIKIGLQLKLSPAERDYFLSLIRLENAKTNDEQLEAERMRLSALKRLVTKEIPAAQIEVLSQWYHLLVRELFLLPDHEPTPEWISRKLADTISPDQAAESLQVLCRSGFLVADGRTFRVADPVVHTNEEHLHAAFMRKHHAALLKMWSQNLDRLSFGEQELGLLNIPISSARLPELRRRIRNFQDEIVGYVQDEKEADRVVQLGCYLMVFPE